VTHQFAIIDGQIRQHKFFIPPDVHLKELLNGNRRGLPDWATD